MKIFKVFVVLASLLLIVAPVWAQFTIIMSETDQMLTTTCAGTTPIPDGTQVQIMWDVDSSGTETAADVPAPLCADPPLCLTGPPQTVNMNSFVMNGVSVELGAGYFYMESALSSVGTIIYPNRFYLRICLPTCHWVSNIVANVDGYAEARNGALDMRQFPLRGMPDAAGRFRFRRFG